MQYPIFGRLAQGCVILPLIFSLLSCSDEALLRSKSDSSVRVVTLGGDVTEIVYALGAGAFIAASDLSSTYPPEILKRPRLNYHRQVSSEGVLSMDPTLVLLTEEAGPPTAIDQIKASGVKVVLIPKVDTAEGVGPKIFAVAEAMALVEEGAKLVEEYETQLAEVLAEVAEYEDRPGVMFLYARQGMGAPMVGGVGSAADAMIELAGGINAATDIEGFKAITPESLLTFQPTCILMMEKGYEAIGGEQGLLEIPGMRETEAGRNKNFVTLPDNLLLSFGPRTPEAIRRLASALHAFDKSTQESGESSE